MNYHDRPTLQAELIALASRLELKHLVAIVRSVRAIVATEEGKKRKRRESRSNRKPVIEDWRI